MTPLTREAIVRGLIAQGVPREAAERQAARETAGAEYREPLQAIAARLYPEEVAAPDAPITLRIPWSALVSDNAMYVVEKTTGRRFKTAEYREARKRIRALATDVMFGPLADRPLAVVGRFWVSSNHRRDTHNLGAALLDSLTGVIWTDDHWLHDVRWIRAGIDVDAPRCELVIRPL